MKTIRKRYVPGGYRLRVGRSKTGLGLFAEEKIPRSACVIEYVGTPVPEAKQYTSRSKYLFGTGRNLMIDGSVKWNTARYINHSCAPNCEIYLKDHRVFVFAKRAIKPGEELNYDYDTEYFDAHIKSKGCRCNKCEPESKNRTYSSRTTSARQR